MAGGLRWGASPAESLLLGREFLASAWFNGC